MASSAHHTPKAIMFCDGLFSNFVIFFHHSVNSVTTHATVMCATKIDMKDLGYG